jgi:predicted nucleic acid-binding protein
MRVLVDTSVWADFFNDAPTPEAELLARLIDDEVELVTCGVVIAEFFQGIRRSSSLPDLERHFRDMECLTPREPDSYLDAAALFRKLRASGVTVRSTIDCLIVTLAVEHNAFLLARDRDVRYILESGLTKARTLPVHGSGR